MAIVFKLVLFCSINLSMVYAEKEIRCKSSSGCSNVQVVELPDIVRRYGYEVETYKVTTQDGYILTIFRIPSNRTNNTPVFLQHGIYLSAIAFVSIGKKSLAFQLADNGYDVWLGNFRGNRYSRTNTFMSNDNLRFWTFSFHELGIYDVYSQVDFVKKKTNQKLIYIGYSMGTTAGYIYSLTYPKIATQNIKAMISLAPIAYLEDIPSPLRYLQEFWLILQPLLDTISHGEIFGRGSSMSEAMRQMCLSSTGQMMVCKGIVQSIFGFDFDQIDTETLPVTMAQNSDSISTRTVTHYWQILNSNNFQYFDYGVAQNLIKYGTITPPLYQLKKILVPIYLIYGQNDYLSTERNVQRLYNQLSIEAKSYGMYRIPYAQFSHDDFITAKDIKTLLYDHIIDFMATLE